MRGVLLRRGEKAAAPLLEPPGPAATAHSFRLFADRTSMEGREGCSEIGPVKSALSVGFIFEPFPGASRPACCRQKRSWPFFCGSCPSGCHRKTRHDLRRGNPLDLSVFWLVWRSLSGFLRFYVMGPTTMRYLVVEFRLRIFKLNYQSTMGTSSSLLSAAYIKYGGLRARLPSPGATFEAAGWPRY